MNNLSTKFESELHVSLNADDHQLRSELMIIGLDPSREAEALRVMIAIALRKAYFTPSIDPGFANRLTAERPPSQAREGPAL